MNARSGDDTTHCDLPANRPPAKKRLWLRRLFRFAGLAVVLPGVVLLFWLRGALYNRYVRFPREEAAWQTLRAQRQPATNETCWT